MSEQHRKACRALPFLIIFSTFPADTLRPLRVKSVSALVRRAVQFKVTRKQLATLEQRFGLELIHHQLYNHAYQLGKGSAFLNASDVIASADAGYGNVSDRMEDSADILAMRKQLTSFER